MPSQTARQHRAMAAAASGRGTLGIPKSVGAEFLHADKGKKFALGGLVHFDDGGGVFDTPTPVPAASAMPVKRGAGPPKPTGGQNPIDDPLQSVMGQIKSLSALKNIANGKAGGGIVGYDDGGDVEGVADPRLNNPQYRAQYERYSSMPPEKLQELAVQLGASPQGQLVNSVLQKQRAVQPATPDIDGYEDGGGVMGMGMASPWWSRRQPAQVDANKSGFLKSTIPGRTDHIPTQAPAGSYVVPADVVSGLGEGNSLAGAKVMQEILKSGPWGTPGSKVHGGRGAPSAPGGRTPPEALAAGGDVGQPTKILAAGGEHVISPDDVRRIGGGSLSRGHRILDRWVVHERKKTIKTMQSLKGPKK